MGFRDECGVFGILNNGEMHRLAHCAYYALYALQHRGQESCGIAVENHGVLNYYKNMGLVHEVFSEQILSGLNGNAAIAHVRYSTAGGSRLENAQPTIGEGKYGKIALVHNGNLANCDKLRNMLAEQGEVFTASNDTELLIKLITKYQVQAGGDLEAAVARLMTVSEGAYAIIVMQGQKLVAFRDPYGIRPLCIGKLGNSYMLASESCAFDALGGEIVRDVLPGEIVTIDKSGLHSRRVVEKPNAAACIFEYVYFARPDSYIDGISVHEARINAGRILARECPCEADMVIGAPDSALAAAIGFARESGIPYGRGLIRNNYIGRTFIQPTQEMRDMAVKIKFNVNRNEIEGKRIVMVDDSIVRGTTTRVIVQMLKKAGAKEVHMRISSPPVKHPCFYGIDTPTSTQLIANRMTVDEIRQMIGADSLGYLSLEGLKQSVPANIGQCVACFTGEYCVPKE